MQNYPACKELCKLLFLRFNIQSQIWEPVRSSSPEMPEFLYGHTMVYYKVGLIAGQRTGFPQVLKSWKTWKITKKSSMHGKVMEFEKI